MHREESETVHRADRLPRHLASSLQRQITPYNHILDAAVLAVTPDELRLRRRAARTPRRVTRGFEMAIWY